MANLWPFVPLLGIQETLEHFSNTLITRTTEQRLSLRYKPRQTFQYVNHLDDYKFARAKAFAGLNLTSPVYVPVWLEAVRLEGLTALDDILTFDVSYGDWREGSHLVVWESYDRYAVCEIQNVATSGFIELTAPVGLDFHQPYVIPVRTCLAKQGYQISRTPTYSRVTAIFTVLDNVQLIADDATTLDGYDVYKSLLVLPAPPHASAPIAESLMRPSTYFDNGFGPQVQVASRIVDDFGQTLSFLDDLGPELWSRRKFLHWIRGKQIPFWYPSYNNDLQLVNPIGSADVTITVRPLADVNVYTGDELMILMKNGTRYYRTITNYSVGFSGHILTISSAIGSNLALADINMVCFMKKVRSNTDSFTFNQAAPRMVSMTMPVITVPE
jgi:hypothetical protein